MTLEALSSLVSVFFFCDPGRIRPGPVGGFARGPRSPRVVRTVQVHADAQNTDAFFGAGDVHPLLFFSRVRGGISTEAAVVGADVSALNEYRLGESDLCIPACIADIVGDIVGVVAGESSSLARLLRIRAWRWFCMHPRMCWEFLEA